MNKQTNKEQDGPFFEGNRQAVRRFALLVWQRLHIAPVSPYVRTPRGDGGGAFCRKEQPTVHTLAAQTTSHAGVPVLPLSPRYIALNLF